MRKKIRGVSRGLDGTAGVVESGASEGGDLVPRTGETGQAPQKTGKDKGEL